MDDTHRVGVGHAVSNLTQNRDDLRERKRATRQFLLNRLTSAVRQSDVGHGLPLADFVDRRDIGVIEAARDLRFTNQASRVLPVLVTGQELQRHLSLQIDVFGQIDDAHPARAKGGVDPEMPDDRACGKHHLTGVTTVERTRAAASIGPVVCAVAGTVDAVRGLRITSINTAPRVCPTRRCKAASAGRASRP